MSEHIVPVRVYLAIFASLMVLTVITVWVAFHDYGVWNPVIALAIGAALLGLLSLSLAALMARREPTP